MPMRSSIRDTAACTLILTSSIPRRRCSIYCACTIHRRDEVYVGSRDHFFYLPTVISHALATTLPYSSQETLSLNIRSDMMLWPSHLRPAGYTIASLAVSLGGILNG